MKNEIFVEKIKLTNILEEDLGFVLLEHLWADVFGLKIETLERTGLETLNGAIRKALRGARTLGARLLMCRLIKGDTGSREVSTLLSKLGFKKKNERIEFKKMLRDLPSNLPDEGSSPIVWKTAEELLWQPRDIAMTLKLVSEGDPDPEPQDDPMLFIEDFLADPVLTCGLQCIHLGFINHEIAAFTVVQINPKTGWSRISYMGLVPKFRKQGLGCWVHRYSFNIMREAGGILYHGGTTSTNINMIRLFESSGCDKFCEMEEWTFSFQAGESC